MKRLFNVACGNAVGIEMENKSTLKRLFNVACGNAVGIEMGNRTSLKGLLNTKIKNIHSKMNFAHF